MGLTELATESGVERSATHRILFTLRKLGYVRQDARTRQYRLGARLLELGDTYSRMNGVRAAAQPILEAANRQCEETVNLTVMEGAEVVYVLRYPSPHVVSVDLRIGSRLPVFCTAPGRAMLAFLDAHAMAKILDDSPLVRRTPFTLTDREEILRVLAKVRREGCCTSNQEAFLGDISIAAPVLGPDALPVAAVNIAVPYPRWSLARVQRELTALVTDCARRIAVTLADN
jgi:DNA-binding IclR family transcriptional regulator